MTKITSSTSLRQYINAVISESQETVLRKRALDEKEKQDTTSSQVSSQDLFADTAEDTTNDASKDASKEPEVAEKPATSKTMDVDKEKLASGDVKVEDVIDAINSIRQGKSLNRDESVKAAFSQYVESLSKAEKTALLAFLKGISQIVTGVVDSETATEPSDNPSDVKMTKGGTSGDEAKGNVRHVKPNVVKNTQTKKQGVEDTTPPKTTQPIVPQRRS